ncbi:MAG: metal ABC transporter solute-binding protein, Zn/Mn family [Acidimicrobiales bacterium]
MIPVWRRGAALAAAGSVILAAAVALTLAATGVLTPAAGPGDRGASRPRPARPLIVAGVSEWAALARAVVGPDGTVVSLLSDPNADPHNHEATPADATHVAQATLVIENGAGYDAWLSQLVAARSRPVAVIDVAHLMHVSTGQNPHLFYNLTASRRLVAALAARLRTLPSGPAIARRARRVSAQLADLAAQVRAISRDCAGVPVAATEDVVTYLVTAMGLHIVTPEALRLAIGNSVDPSIHDLALALVQLTHHPALLVDNVQTATPLTQEMVRVAQAHGVPVVRVTETLIGKNDLALLRHVIGAVRHALHEEGCVP